MKFMRAAKMPIESLCKAIVVGGEAGEGIKSAGIILANSLLKSKFNTFVYDEFPSLIRGGHNSVNITYSPYPVYAPNREIDILVCLDKLTFDTHKGNLHQGSVVLYDHDDFAITDEEAKDYPCELIDIPITSIIKKNKLPGISKNILYISCAACIIGLDEKIFTKCVEQKLKKKHSLLEMNVKCVELAYEEVSEFSNIRKYPIGDAEKEEMNGKPVEYFMTGNEAISLGSVHAGMGFYAAYPMTPASSLLDYLAGNFRKFNLVVKQTEDEIAAINMAIGASFAGARAMVGTSGGGFSLMVEALGLAAITETPLVIVLAQRPGPATGLPTWTGQADLLFALHSSQDEFPRIILTPTDGEECFELAFKAFNLAEKYQVPVIVMTDKFLADSISQFPINFKVKRKIDRGLLLNERLLARVEEYRRYEFTNSGVSPRSLPGMKNGVFLANSDESDQKGYTAEDSDTRNKKVEKRFKKVEEIVKDMPDLNVYGDIRAKTCLITWGSTKGPALEAVRRLQNIGVSVKLLALNYVEPFPTEEVSKFLNTSKRVVLIEGNYTAQLGQLIMQNTGYDIKNKLLKYDGRPIYPDEIADFIQELEA